MKVELSYSGECVTAIGLPERPPADLTPDTLRYLEKELAALPLQFPEATPFRRRVWEAIRHIPFGQTITYKELAKSVGNPQAARAVGGACGANRLLLAVPCHRVVASNGGLGGFTLGLEWKQRLLELEATGAATTSRASESR